MTSGSVPVVDRWGVYGSGQLQRVNHAAGALIEGAVECDPGRLGLTTRTLFDVEMWSVRYVPGSRRNIIVKRYAEGILFKLTPRADCQFMARRT